MNTQKNDNTLYNKMQDFITQEFGDHDLNHKWSDDEVMQAHMKVEKFFNEIKGVDRKEMRRMSASTFVDYPIQTKLFTDIALQFMELAIEDSEKRAADPNNPFASKVSISSMENRGEMLLELQENFTSVITRGIEKYKDLQTQIELVKVLLEDLSKENKDVSELSVQFEKLKNEFDSYYEEDFFKLFYPDIPNKKFRKTYKKSLSQYCDDFAKNYQRMVFLVESLEKNIKNFDKNKERKEYVKQKKQEISEKKIFQNQEVPKSHLVVQKANEKIQEQLPNDPTREEKRVNKISRRIDNLEKIQQKGNLSDAQRQELFQMKSFLESVNLPEWKSQKLCHDILKKIQKIYDNLYM